MEEVRLAGENAMLAKGKERPGIPMKNSPFLTGLVY